MIYELDLQVEHEGDHIDTSLAFVQNSSGQVYLEMLLKPKVLLAQDPERGVIRFVDYFSLNGRRNFQSMIPTMVANCELYNNTPRALKHYVSRTLNELLIRGYPKKWWHQAFLRAYSRELRSVEARRTRPIR